MGDPYRARRRRQQLDARPELVRDLLATPLGNARAAVAVARELSPDVGRLRVAMGVEHELRTTLASLAGHRSSQERSARAVLRDLRSYINRPDGIGQYPHLHCTPRHARPWPWACWQRHLANLQLERPEWRSAIDQDWQWLKRQENEAAAEREMGTFFSGAMPRKVVALLEDAKALAPTLDLAQRANLHRRLNRVLIKGAWEPHPAEHVLATLAPPELYGMLPAGSA